MSSEQVPLIPNTNLPDTIYCAEQIKIPAQLPEILKNYTKHIIKTQPTDLVAASAEYFGKLAKQRIKALHGSTLQTPQQIEAIYKKLATQENGNHSKDGIFSREDFSVLCVDITNDQVTEIFKLGGWGSDAPWIKFWALLVASNAGSIHSSVDLICDILGDNNMINCNPFSTVFGFLAGRDPDILPSKAEKILKFLSDKQSVEIDALKIMIAAEIPIKYDVVYKIEATKHDEPIVEKAVVNTVESAFEIADEPISDVVLETSADLVMETEQLERTVEPIVETSVEVVKEASSDVVPMDESNGLDSVVAEDTGVEDQPAQEEPVVENTDVAMDTAVEEIQENAD